jgi:glycosyltransferase involved in cell wall biosynthesis
MKMPCVFAERNTLWAKRTCHAFCPAETLTVVVRTVLEERLGPQDLLPSISSLKNDLQFVRVLVIVGTLQTGGTEHQFARISDGLARRGHDVTVVSLWPGGQYWKWLDDRGTVRLQSLCKQKPESRVGTAIQLLKACVYLRRLTRQYRPEVMYSAHDLTHLVGWLALLGRRDVPVAWGIRASQVMSHWKRLVPLYLCRQLSGTADLIIPNSYAGRDYYQSLGFRGRRWEVIPNGIDTRHFSIDRAGGGRVREEWEVEEGEKVVGIVGRVSPIKGHRLFLRAAALLAQKDRELRFVCVGGGGPSYRKEMKALAERLGIAGRVRWTGVREDMPRVYNALDVLVLCSIAEGWPNVLGEALSCGVPAVATDAGDARRMLPDRYIVTPRSPSALAEAIAGRLVAPGTGEETELEKYAVNDIEECIAETERSLNALVKEEQPL